MTKTQLRQKIVRTELIHYGNKGFDNRKFDKIQNADFEKPIGGLWTSPTKSEYGFHNYNKNATVRDYDSDEFFKLKLNEDAKVLIIDTKKDLQNAPHRTILETDFFIHSVMDFEKIAEKYDAIWLTLNGMIVNKEFTEQHKLMAWDCETVLILNPNCFKPKKTTEYIQFLKDQTQNEIIYYLKMGYSQAEIIETFEKQEIKICLSSIEKFIHQIKSDYKAKSLFQLGYILGQLDEKQSNTKEK